MRRSNTFKVVFKHPEQMVSLGEGCVVLWNVLNYKRRQQFFETGSIVWDWKAEYDSFKGWVGSATAQQIIRKNGDAWRGFFELKAMEARGECPAHIKNVSPPGYWKDKNTGEPVLRVLFRCDKYKIKGRKLSLQFGIKGRIKGRPRWTGKQGLLELRYDHRHRCWRAYQSITTEQVSQPSGHNKAYVDIGVRCPIAAVITGHKQPIVYSGNEMLSDWWHWNKRIARHQSILKTTNDRDKSRQLSWLYRKRTRHHRDMMNKLVAHFIQVCKDNGVDEIFVGDLTGILENNDHGKKTNTMVHNFWSHKQLVDRLRCTAENHGIAVTLVDEAYTSSVCPRCDSTKATKRGRLYKCKACRAELHRDVVGAINISAANPLGDSGRTNWAMTRPQVVKTFSSHGNNLKRISPL